MDQMAVKKARARTGGVKISLAVSSQVAQVSRYQKLITLYERAMLGGGFLFSLHLSAVAITNRYIHINILYVCVRKCTRVARTVHVAEFCTV